MPAFLHEAQAYERGQFWPYNFRLRQADNALKPNAPLSDSSFQYPKKAQKEYEFCHAAQHGNLCVPRKFQHYHQVFWEHILGVTHFLQAAHQ